MEQSSKVEQGDTCFESLENRQETIELLEKILKEINEKLNNSSNRKDKFLEVIIFNNN